MAGPRRGNDDVRAIRTLLSEQERQRWTEEVVNRLAQGRVDCVQCGVIHMSAPLGQYNLGEARCIFKGATVFAV
eukprot:6179863-Amphidinium_carterae.1